MRLINQLVNSIVVEILLTVAVYSVYAVVLAAGICPTVWLLLWTLPSLLAGFGGAAGTGGAITAVLSISGVLAAGFYLHILSGGIIQALVVRILSLGIKAGRYPAISLTTVRWLIYSGIYNISTRLILPFVPVTFVINMYFRIVGCKMGKKVKLNTFMLNDAYLLRLGDNVIVGGQTDISCHLFENDHLILKPVSIGNDTLIGAHCYVSPGVTIGNGCVVGLNSYLRMNRDIPDGMVITSVAGVEPRTARLLEKRGLAREGEGERI